MRDLHLLVESQSYCSPVTVVKCVLFLYFHIEGIL